MWTDRSNPIPTKIDGHAIPVILGAIGGLDCFLFSSGDHGTMCFRFGDGDVRLGRVRPPSDRSRVGRDVTKVTMVLTMTIALRFCGLGVLALDVYIKVLVRCIRFLFQTLLTTSQRKKTLKTPVVRKNSLV